MTIDEALQILRARVPLQDIHSDDARSLLEPLRALALNTPSDRIDRVGEALLSHELERLIWIPIEGARLVLALIERRAPSRHLMELALFYLSCFFKELDEAIEIHRLRVEGGQSLLEISNALSEDISQLYGMNGDL